MPQRPTSVAFFTGDYYPDQVGGQGIYAYEVTTRLAAAGLNVRVICPDHGGRRRFRYTGGLNVDFLPAWAVNPILFSAEVLRSGSELTRYDVLHVNELFGFSLAVLKRAQTRLVVSSHNAYLDRFRAAVGWSKLKYPPLIALEAISYRRADRVIIGSEIERAPVEELGVRPERVVAIPYGVDIARFEDPDGARRRLVREQLEIPEDARVVLFVGRFVERKKPHIVAAASRKLCALNSDLHAILIGDGEMMAAVQQIVGDEPRIHLRGAVPFSELPQYYAAADVFTLPSVGEGSISLVVLEAAAAGLPLVLTEDSSGGSPVFEHGSNGELASLDDSDSLATALERALARGRKYGARSRAIVLEQFSWDACAMATLRCYEST